MVSETSEKERFVDVHELASFLCVPESWIYARTASGEIPHRKIGRYVRFLLPEVVEWLREDPA